MNSQSTRWVDKLTDQKLLLNTQMIIMGEACAFRRFYRIDFNGPWITLCGNSIRTGFLRM